MSQRYGRFCSIEYNAIGYTGDIKKPNWVALDRAA